MAHLRDLASRHGFEFVAFDYRGHGDSSGQFLSLGVDDWLKDTQAVMASVVTTRDVVLVGASRLPCCVMFQRVAAVPLQIFHAQQTHGSTRLCQHWLKRH